MEPVSILEPIIAAAAAANPEKPGDYAKDGILHCGFCHTPKQKRLQIPAIGVDRTVSCLCRCAQARYEAEEAERKRREEADRIGRLRSVGITSQTLRGATFASDDGKNPEVMAKVRRYAAKWPRMEEQNIGLLLSGDVGTGKSFAAACVANALIDAGVPVYMDNLAAILNSVAGRMGEEKNAFIRDLMEYPLLILDDFGMERQTEYALEMVFHLVDSRYRAGKPLIVTTNLSLTQLKEPATLAQKRIYDRILELCVPLHFGTRGRRAEKAGQKMKQAAQLLRE